MKSYIKKTKNFSYSDKYTLPSATNNLILYTYVIGNMKSNCLNISLQRYCLYVID